MHWLPHNCQSPSKLVRKDIFEKKAYLIVKAEPNSILCVSTMTYKFVLGGGGGEPPQKKQLSNKVLLLPAQTKEAAHTTLVSFHRPSRGDQSNRDPPQQENQRIKFSQKRTCSDLTTISSCARNSKTLQIPYNFSRYN